uniref:Teratocyte bracovirus bV7 II n=1 Tax=Cotesia flavipes TaxID=89805 RepID=A0A8K1YTT3_COTFL|nr:teratocyte bracovirus bV7 II [Cotesia flavipes]
MFVKSTVTLFVLAVGLLSFLSGSASAYPRPGELTIKQATDDNSELKLFESYFNRKPETYYGAQSYLHQYAIQGSNMEGKNYIASQINQSHLKVKGAPSETSQNFGALTVGSYNTIQESNSKSKNILGSVVDQNDVTYDFSN